MRSLLRLAASLSVVAFPLATHATTAILFPLYFDPDPATCWPELQAAAKANPSVPFVLIINPNSGPTTDPTDAQLQCIPTIRAAMPTAKIVGYVSTDYGNRGPAQVRKDITTYRTYSGFQEGDAKIPIDGIFLDETSSSTSRSIWFLYQGYSQFIKRSFSNAYIVMNPGTAVSPRLYSLANLLVTFESPYSAWNPSLINTASNTPLSKQAIMIHTFPSQEPDAVNDMDAILAQFAPSLGAIYITNRIDPDVDVYGDFGTDWNEFVGEVAKYETPPAAKRSIIKLYNTDTHTRAPRRRLSMSFFHSNSKPSRFAQAAILLLTSVTSVKATGVIIPLYSSSSTCWPELQTGVKANPSVPFTVIINPSSGPLSDVSEPVLACIPTLRSVLNSESKIVGYVSTQYGNRDQSAVTAGIQEYQSWSSLTVSGTAIPIDGVFLDECSDSESTLSIYTAYSKTINSAFSDGIVVLNPGTTVPASFFDIASIIVTFEDAYSNWKTISASSDKPLSKQAIIIHSIPIGTDEGAILSSIGSSLNSAFFSNYVPGVKDPYQNFAPDWTTFVADLASLNGGSSAGSGTGSGSGNASSSTAVSPSPRPPRRIRALDHLPATSSASVLPLAAPRPRELGVQEGAFSVDIGIKAQIELFDFMNTN
ncbi:hypothetical protein T439DRAFT_376599 [Meredithblackwellia eburnea MCA 4105]